MNANIQVEVGAITDALVRVADQQRLRQVILEPVQPNAIKYNRPQGQVFVGTEVIEDMVRISVSDTGLGIGPEMVERLFIPFDRLNVEATGIEGTGLGLALSKNLTEAMGGTLTFDSTPGKGSIFTIQLPIYKAAEENAGWPSVTLEWTSSTATPFHSLHTDPTDLSYDELRE